MGWEGGKIGFNELVDLDEGRCSLNKIWSRNAREPCRVWDQCRVIELFSPFVSPVENLDFRQEHRRFHMQDK